MNERIYHLVDCAVPAGHRVKVKVKESLTNYWILLESKKQKNKTKQKQHWNMKEIVIPGVLGTVAKEALKKLEDLVRFYDMSTLVGYLMPNPFLYIYIKYLAWFGFMAYQLLLVF